MSADRAVPFLTCTNCGQKSTDIKRCKHCGRAFGALSQAASDSSSKASWRPAFLMIALVAIAAVGFWQWKQEPAVPSVVPGPVPALDTTIPAAPAETVAAAPVAAPPAQKEALAATPADTVRQSAPVQPEPAPERPPQPVAIDPARQRYALTWANVRSERSNTARVVQVLDKGEIVAVDSLEGGWYRVTTDRPLVGYVDQQYLDTLPPGSP